MQLTDSVFIARMYLSIDFATHMLHKMLSQLLGIFYQKEQKRVNLIRKNT